MRLIASPISGATTIDALKGATDGEDSSFDLQEIVNSLMGEGTKLSDLIKALKDQGIDADGISDLLVGGSLTYKWYVRDGKNVVEVSAAKDKNTYDGATDKTLTVSRKTAPKETETYTYFVTVSMDSLEASLAFSSSSKTKGVLDRWRRISPPSGSSRENVMRS